MPVSAPPLLLFLSREFAAKAYSEQEASPAGWARAMAGLMERQLDLRQIVEIAAALPLPANARQQQSILELALCMLPTRVLWRLRPYPKPPIEDKHEAYWKAVEPFLANLLAQPDIDPLSRLSNRDMLTKTGAGKLPIAVIAMQLGRSELLEKCTQTLPQEFLVQAVETCAQFSKVDLAEQLIARWDASDPQGKAAAQETLWHQLPVRALTGETPLPASDPPYAWWLKAAHHLSEMPVCDRVLADRPHLNEHLTNALLCGSEVKVLMHLQRRGGLGGRSDWVSREGWTGPPSAMVVSTWAGQNASHNYTGSVCDDLESRLSLVNRLLPGNARNTQAHQDWLRVAENISFKANPNAYKAKPKPCSIDAISDISLRWKSEMLQGNKGLPSLSALSPILRAAWVSCETYTNEPLPALDEYFRLCLPFVREMAANANAQCLSREQSELFKKAAEDFLCPPIQPNQSSIRANVDMVLEALLWRVAFARLNGRAKYGRGRVFPPSVHEAKTMWNSISVLLEQGAMPRWSHEDAKVMHSLTHQDPKVPFAIKMLIEAEALRAGQPHAIAKPRRI